MIKFNWILKIKLLEAEAIKNHFDLGCLIKKNEERIYKHINTLSYDI